MRGPARPCVRGCPVRGCSVRAWPALRTRLAVRAWLLTPCVRGWFCGAAVIVWLAGRAWLWDMAGGPACMGVCVWLRGGRAALRVLLALRGRWAAVMHPAAARPCMHLHGWSSVAPVAGNVCVRLFGWPCKCGNCHGGEVAQQLPNLAPGITSQDERESAFMLCSWICVSTDATATALPAPMALTISAMDVIIRSGDSQAAHMDPEVRPGRVAKSGRSCIWRMEGGSALPSVPCVHSAHYICYASCY